MDSLLTIAQINDLWFTLPLIASVSLVYAATRHELIVPILLHSLRIAVWIVGFMAVIFVVILLIAWRL